MIREESPDRKRLRDLASKMFDQESKNLEAFAAQQIPALASIYNEDKRVIGQVCWMKHKQMALNMGVSALDKMLRIKETGYIYKQDTPNSDMKKEEIAALLKLAATAKAARSGADPKELVDEIEDEFGE